jgi:hypothetical protein
VLSAVLTLFSTPKPFRGHVSTIQRNAIRSWTLLDPRPEIVLLGNDEGVAEICAELHLQHLPEVERSPYGTPLLNSLFGHAERASENRLMCYVNADIVLMNDFLPTVEAVDRAFPEMPFLMIGRKRNVAISELLDFTREDWEGDLRDLALRKGITGTADTDYLVFRRGLWQDIPPFAIGRYFWTQWLIFSAFQSGAAVIDATACVTAIESAHDYRHVPSVQNGDILSSPEVRSNAALFRGCRYWTTANATHVLTREGIEPQSAVRKLLASIITLDHTLGLLAKSQRYVLLLPFLGLYRLIRPVPRALRRYVLGCALK